VVNGSCRGRLRTAGMAGSTLPVEAAQNAITFVSIAAKPLDPRKPAA